MTPHQVIGMYLSNIEQVKKMKRLSPLAKLKRIHKYRLKLEKVSENLIKEYQHAK